MWIDGTSSVTLGGGAGFEVADIGGEVSVVATASLSMTNPRFDTTDLSKNPIPVKATPKWEVSWQATLDVSIFAGGSATFGTKTQGKLSTLPILNVIEK